MFALVKTATTNLVNNWLIFLASGCIDECFSLFWFSHGSLAVVNLKTSFHWQVFFSCKSGFSVHKGVWLSRESSSSGLILDFFVFDFLHKHVFDCLIHLFANSFLRTMGYPCGPRFTPWYKFVCALTASVTCFLGLVHLSLFSNLFLQISIKELRLCPFMHLSLLLLLLLRTDHNTTVIAADDGLSLCNKKLDIFVLLFWLLAEFQLAQNSVLSREVSFQIGSKEVNIVLWHNLIQGVSSFRSPDALIRPFNLFLE